MLAVEKQSQHNYPWINTDGGNSVSNIKKKKKKNCCLMYSY